MTTDEKEKTPIGFTLIHKLRADQKMKMNRIGWSPDGNLLAAACDDNKILLWDIETGTLVKELFATSNRSYSRIHSVTWSPDGKIIASGSDTVKFWEVATGVMWKEIGANNDGLAFNAVKSMAWSPDGSKVAWTAGNCAIYIYYTNPLELWLMLDSPPDQVYCIAWSPDGQALASSSGDGHIRIWSGRTGRLRHTLRHSRRVYSVAWSPDGAMLASSTDDRAIRLWDTESGNLLRILEGHTGTIRSVCFSPDGYFLASKSTDNNILLWRSDTWKSVAKLNEKASRLWITSLAFHPEKLMLASLEEETDVIRVWKLDQNLLYGEPPITDYIHYTSAKIILVGESNVGKSCLALRLTEDRYEEQGSTTGMRFWPIAPEKLDPEAIAPTGDRREIVFWDMGGQDEYRLVHQIFFDNTSLALILLDPTRGRVAFDEVERWNKQLEKHLEGSNAVKILIGAKLDYDNTTIDQARIDRFVAEHGFAGYYQTSAKLNRGINELRLAISKALDWANLGKTNRPKLFQYVLDEVERRRRLGDAVLMYSELERDIKNFYPDMFDPKAVDAVVKQLAVQGIIKETYLDTQERALVLEIGGIGRYAGSLIVAARNNLSGVPAIENAKIPTQDMIFPGIDLRDRLPREQELIVLQCVVQLLLSHGICLQHEGLLIFPTLFQTEQSNYRDTSYPSSVRYDFSGSIENIYSSLVVMLSISNRFGRVRLWEDRAEFSQTSQPLLPGQVFGDGELETRAEFGQAQVGTCGLYKSHIGGGNASLAVYFDEEVSKETRAIFINFIEEHLRQQGVIDYEYEKVVCKSCGFVFDPLIIRGRFERGEKDIGCSACDSRTLLIAESLKILEPDFLLKEETFVLKKIIEQNTEEIVQETGKMFDRSKLSALQEEYIRILHLSDLHMDAFSDHQTMLEQVVLDLYDKRTGQGIERFDYLVISGDLTNTARAEEFEMARLLISGLINKFGLSAERCIIAPGNHDISWEESVYDWNGRRSHDIRDLNSSQYVEQEKVLGIRNNDRYPMRFKSFSKNFYHPLIQKEYPLDFEQQCIPFFFPDTGILFLSMNSCWEIDEFFQERSSINSTALSNGLHHAAEEIGRAARSNQLLTNASILKIAIWHHPVAGNEKIKEDAFLNRLQKAGIRICLHGHVHEDRADLVNYLDPSQRIHIVGAGSFGAPSRARPETMPRLYNVLEISRNHSLIRVHTRCLRKADGAWEPWAVWPGNTPNERRAYYEINFQ